MAHTCKACSYWLSIPLHNRAPADVTPIMALEEHASDVTSLDSSSGSSCRSTRRTSLTTPMRKLIKRLSGVPSDCRPAKSPRVDLSIEKRLSFTSWKHRRPTTPSKPVLREEPQIRAPLVPLTATRPQFRQPLAPLRPAPIALPEESFLGEPAKPKAFKAAARRLSGLTAGPIWRITLRKRATQPP